MGIMQLIVDQTNLYASQVMAPDKFAAWEQATVPELKAYFGFMILMGINKLPALVDYWKVDPIFHYAPVAGRIARDRFFAISRYLHFADNTQLLPNTDPAHDKLGESPAYHRSPQGKCCYCLTCFCQEGMGVWV